MNIVCWGNGLQRFVPLRDQSGETLRTANRNNRLKSYGRPRIIVVDQQRSLCSGTFAEKVESDGTLLEMTPWRQNLRASSGFGDVERNAAKKPTNALRHPGVVISNTLATDWIAYRGSLVKCARSQVRPFREDEEAAHEHVTEHMRDLGRATTTGR